MENNPNKADITLIKKQAIQVITDPAEFFRSMRREGGFAEPMIFIAVIGFAVGIIRAVLTVGTSFGSALGVLIITPLIIPFLAFIGAAIVFLIWKLMGSRQSYETAYRCLAYSSAIAPITALLGLIPYAGGIAATAWGCYIYYLASVSVHEIAQKKARMVWGILFIMFSLIGISGERGTRVVSDWEQRYGNDSDAAAEEAGRAVGNFLRGLEEAAQKESGEQR